MNKEEYKIMFNIEDNYWWYVGLRQLVLSCIGGEQKGVNLRILDAGCGTGGMSACLRDYKSCAIDYSDEAVTFSKTRKINNIARASVCSMPFKNGVFDIVISLDVLYHINVVDDVDTLKEINRVIDEKGLLLLHLPAYNFLRSRHDEAVHTRHRYTVKELRKKVEAAGFEIDKITYRNVFLFPIALTRRILEKLAMSNCLNTKSELKPLSSLTNSFFTRILLIENKLIRNRITFPFGLSIFCVAKKKRNSTSEGTGY